MFLVQQCLTNALHLRNLDVPKRCEAHFQQAQNTSLWVDLWKLGRCNKSGAIIYLKAAICPILASSSPPTPLHAHCVGWGHGVGGGGYLGNDAAIDCLETCSQPAPCPGGVRGWDQVTSWGLRGTWGQVASSALRLGEGGGKPPKWCILLQANQLPCS